MAACAHRPEDGSSLVPCAERASLVHNRPARTCLCAEEVKAEFDAAVVPVETRAARVPDSARAQDTLFGGAA